MTENEEREEHHCKVWAIARERAWQVCKNLGIMNHTQRHWGAT